MIQFIKYFIVAASIAFQTAQAAPGLEPGNGKVTLAEDASAYTLANGIVTARVHKRSGDLLSLKYQDLELLGGGSGHPYGYWSHSPARGATNFITISPAQNGG